MAELGNTRRVYIVTGSGSTYAALKGEQTNSVNRSAESIDISDKDSGAWGNTMAGKKSLTLDVTVYADNTDAQQKHRGHHTYRDDGDFPVLVNGFAAGIAGRRRAGNGGGSGNILQKIVIQFAVGCPGDLLKGKFQLMFFTFYPAGCSTLFKFTFFDG